MGAQLRGVEVYFSYGDERFHIHIPAALSPIIGKHGVLRCRLDGVRRRGSTDAASRDATFEASFGIDRQLVIPSRMANYCGISGGSWLDLTILERLNLKRGWFRRQPKYLPIYPNDTVIFDHGDAASFAPPDEGSQPRLALQQLGRSIERETVKLMATALSLPSPSPAPADAKAPIDDEAADRRRWLESLDLHHASKAGSVVDKTRGIGIVPPEQPIRQARGG